MTEMVWLLEPYVKEFASKVVSADGKFVILEKTAFYPNAGGQPNDTGTISSNGVNYSVVFVQKKGETIMHELDKSGLKAGDQVTGTIDWARRYYLMRSHTAAHVLSRVIFDETGALTSGNQLDLDKSRIDFTLENFDKEKLKFWESRANFIISSASPVILSLLPREKAFKIPDLIRTNVLLLPETVQTIRVVEITDFDQQACGGAHVKNTSEIGGIEITGTENKGKNNRRIYFRILEGNS